MVVFMCVHQNRKKTTTAHTHTCQKRKQNANRRNEYTSYGIAMENDAFISFKRLLDPMTV